MNKTSNEVHQRLRQKLDELDYIPGEPVPDYNRIWQRLEDRLQENQEPVKKRPYWIWIAAACILVAIIVPWMANQKASSIQIPSARTKMMENKQHELVKEDPGPIIKQMPVNNNSIPVLMVKAGAKETKGSVKPTNPQLPQVDTVANLVQINSNPKSPVNNLQVVATKRVTIPVVHINDLSIPAIAPAVVQNNQPQQKTLKFSNNEILVEEVSEPGIKINLSPQN